MLEDIVSMSVLLVYIIPAGLYLYTKNTREIVALVGVLGTGLISEGIKYGIVKEYSVRPKGAHGCDMWCLHEYEEGKPGMPSGHSSMATFFAGYYFNESDSWIQFALILFAISVMISRYTKRCHSIPQIVAGGLFGLAMSQLVKQLEVR
jgi:membrane-associated phospholipid phosphatase